MRNNNIIVILASIVGLSFIGATAVAQKFDVKDPQAQIRFFNTQKGITTNYACPVYEGYPNLKVSLDNTHKVSIIDDLINDHIVTYSSLTNSGGTYSFVVKSGALDSKIAMACADLAKKTAVPNSGNTCKVEAVVFCTAAQKATEKYDEQKVAAQKVAAATQQNPTQNGNNGQSGNNAGQANNGQVAPKKESTQSYGSLGGSGQKSALDTESAAYKAGVENGKNPNSLEYPKIYPATDKDGKPTGNYTIKEKTDVGVDSIKTFDKYGNQLSSNDKAVQKAIDDMPERTPAEKAAKEKAKGAVASSQNPTEDTKAKATKEERKKETDSFVASVKSQMENFTPELSCQEDPTLQQADLSCASELTQKKSEINTALDEYASPKASCDSNAVSSDNFCSLVRNKTVTDISAGLAASSSVVQAMAGASEVCKYTSNINLIGQSVFLASNLTCEGFRMACKITCANSEKKLSSISEKLAELAAITKLKPTAQGNVSNVTALIQNETTTKVVVNQQTCKEHAANGQAMVTMAMGMLSAYGQAKACEQQLAAMDATNNSAQSVSMDEMCSQPANASSTVCKCRTDNTAVGCPGYLAGAGNEGNINKGLNTKGTSNMAGLSYGSSIKPGSAAGLDTNLDGLGDEAKAALAAGGDQKQEASMFGTAGGPNAGGLGGTGGGAGVAGSDKGKSAEEPKSIGSSFMNAVGSLFKGSGSPKAAPTKEDKFSSDKYKEQIKRQIAAEQMRSEISSASGMDNWSKIRSRYKSNAGSLIDSN